MEWAKHTSKLSGPIKTLAEAINTQTQSAFSTVAGWFDSVLPENFVTNPDFRVFQRGTSITSTTTATAGVANTDDTYVADGWILLSNGNDIVDITQTTSTTPTGAYSAIALDVETANAKFGIFHPIEARDAEKILNGTVSLSFQYRISGSSLTKLRAGIVTWSSTADSITSDIVSAWNAEGTNPTLATNWTYENTPADLTTPTTSFQTASIENISLDTASGTNVGIFIWIENTTTTVGDFLYLTNVNLIRGADADLSVQSRSYQEELLRCRRYLRHWKRATTQESIAIARAASTTVALGTVRFEPPMRSTPTASVSSATGFQVRDDGADTVTTAMNGGAILTADSSLIQATVGAVLTASESCEIAFGSSTEAFIQWSAEL